MKNRVTEERFRAMRGVNIRRQCLPSAEQNKLEGLIVNHDDDDKVWRKLLSKDTSRTALVQWKQGQATAGNFGAGACRNI